MNFHFCTFIIIVLSWRFTICPPPALLHIICVIEMVARTVLLMQLFRGTRDGLCFWGSCRA